MNLERKNFNEVSVELSRLIAEKAAAAERVFAARGNRQAAKNAMHAFIQADKKIGHLNLACEVPD